MNDYGEYSYPDDDLAVEKKRGSIAKKIASAVAAVMAVSTLGGALDVATNPSHKEALAKLVGISAPVTNDPNIAGVSMAGEISASKTALSAKPNATEPEAKQEKMQVIENSGVKVYINTKSGLPVKYEYQKDGETKVVVFDEQKMKEQKGKVINSGVPELIDAVVKNQNTIVGYPDTILPTEKLPLGFLGKEELAKRLVYVSAPEGIVYGMDARVFGDKNSSVSKLLKKGLAIDMVFVNGPCLHRSFLTPGQEVLYGSLLGDRFSSTTEQIDRYKQERLTSIDELIRLAVDEGKNDELAQGGSNSQILTGMGTFDSYDKYVEALLLEKAALLASDQTGISVQEACSGINRPINDGLAISEVRSGGSLIFGEEIQLNAAQKKYFGDDNDKGPRHAVVFVALNAGYETTADVTGIMFGQDGKVMITESKIDHSSKPAITKDSSHPEASRYTVDESKKKGYVVKEGSPSDHFARTFHHEFGHLEQAWLEPSSPTDPEFYAEMAAIAEIKRAGTAQQYNNCLIVPGGVGVVLY